MASTKKTNFELKIKSDKELSTLTDRNLLAYFRAERTRFLKFESDHNNKYGTLPETYRTDAISLNDVSSLLSLAKLNEWRAYVMRLKSFTSERSNVESKNTTGAYASLNILSKNK